MCPSMSLDDYFKIYKPQVVGDINYENHDGDVEGDINYGNDGGEKTNNNPMEGNIPTIFHLHHLYLSLVVHSFCVSFWLPIC